jgi:hypothetical protein
MLNPLQERISQYLCGLWIATVVGKYAVVDNSKPVDKTDNKRITIS